MDRLLILICYEKTNNKSKEVANWDFLCGVKKNPRPEDTDSLFRTHKKRCGCKNGNVKYCIETDAHMEARISQYLLRHRSTNNPVLTICREPWGTGFLIKAISAKQLYFISKKEYSTPKIRSVGIYRQKFRTSGEILTNNGIAHKNIEEEIYINCISSKIRRRWNLDASSENWKLNINRFMKYLQISMTRS